MRIDSEALRARRAGLLKQVATRADSCEETADGYRLVFPAASAPIHALAAMIDAERQCCRWLRLDVVVEPDGGPIVLTLSGPDGAPAFLAALIAE